MNARVRALIAPGVATLVGVAILIGLGDWQLRRLAWKEALIAAVETRAHAAPVDAPPESEWPRLDPADYEYKRVRLSGVFDGSRQVSGVSRPVRASRALRRTRLSGDDAA